MTLKSLLVRSGVSKTAYYHLASKDSVLPRSIRELAEALDVEPLEILEARSKEERAARLVADRTDDILRRHPGLDRDNVRHSLILLSEKPAARLRRALIRGRRNDFFKTGDPVSKRAQ